MTTAKLAELDIIQRLSKQPKRREFNRQVFFQLVRRNDVSKQQAAIILGQWWHPLRYFTTFLARCIAVLPEIEAKSALSNILAQEAGAGHPKDAHEVIFVDTMCKAGFTEAEVSGAEPFPETVQLVNGYRTGSSRRLSALGCVFATEVTDLIMVSSIGKAVTAATGVRRLEWVDIHIDQEPGHVEDASSALLTAFTPSEINEVIDAADHMWQLWISFFDRITLEMESLNAAPNQARYQAGQTLQ